MADESSLGQRVIEGIADGVKPEAETEYEVVVTVLGGGVMCQPVKGVHLWAIEDGRLTFRDGNREYIAIFNQWLYFTKGKADTDGRRSA